MPTYFPVADGNVTFHEHGCQQIVTADGLTIESPTAENLVAYGQLREGTSTAKTQVENLPDEVTDQLADYAAPVTPAPDADKAPPAKADNVPTPPAPDPAQPSGPAATDSPPREK